MNCEWMVIDVKHHQGMRKIDVYKKNYETLNFIIESF